MLIDTHFLELIGPIDFALSHFGGLGCIVFKMLGNDLQLIVEA